MKPYFAGIVAWILLGGASISLFGQDAKKDKAPAERPFIDITKPETPRKPLPAWIKADARGEQVWVDQEQSDPRLKGYFTPEGVKVEIVADFPAVTNPVGMAFANDGSLLVLEWTPGEAAEATETITYKDGTTRKVPAARKATKDIVKVLRDSKGAGVFDEAKVVLEEELPSSILLHDGWLYLSGRGNVRRYKLVDVLDRPAAKEQPKAQIVAQGFGGFHHRQVSGLTVGNEGWLYITTGDGDHYVEGADGSRATVLRTGAIFRCRPDGSKLHVYSIGYQNPYRDLAFDANFNAFTADNDGGGGKFTGCRLMHVAEESDFGWRLLSGARGQPDPVRAAVFGELPGKLAPLAKTGRGAPAGLFIYNETRFPEGYRGVIYYPDVVRKSIRAYKVVSINSTFAIGSEFELLKSDDPLFRPCQIVAGPDGAMYVCDWRTDPAATGRFSADGKHGRIYRLTWAGTAEQPAIARRPLDSWARFAAMSADDLLKALDSPDFSDRLKAQRLLVNKGTDVRNGLLDLLDEPKRPTHARIAALGALQWMWNDEVRDEFLNILYAGDSNLRRLAAEGLALNCKLGDAEVDAALLQVLGDQDLAARRAIVLAIGKIGGPSAIDSLVNTFRANREDDPYYNDAILRSIERLGQPGIAKLVALAQSGVEKDFDKVVVAFQSLRSRVAAEAIPDLLNYPHLSILERVNLIKSYSNYALDPPVPLGPLLKYLDAHKDEPPRVKLAALEVLAMPGPPKSDKAEELALALLQQTDVDFRTAVLGAIEHGRLTKAAGRVNDLLADASRPDAERVAVVKALRALDHKAAGPALKDIVSGKENASAVLRGEALRTLTALDLTAGQDAAKILLAGKDVDLQREAVVVLGSQPDGARLVGEQFLAKKLPRELLAQVTEALRKHPRHPEVVKLLAEITKGNK